MTRDAEHTPSPQSVPLWMMHVIGPDDIYPAPDHATAVQWCAYLNSEIAPKVPEVLCVAVPAIWTGTAEEHAEGLAEAIKGWAVPAAPAPSSLAGGEVYEVHRALMDVVAQIKGIRFGYAHGGEGYLEDKEVWERAQRLAALSPEAPAREGVVMAASDAPMWADGIATDGENVAMAQKAETDHGGHYWAVDGGNGGLDWEPTHFISLDALAALSPEDPAREGANDNPLTFGMGELVVNTGKFGGDNAVFIARAKEPGEVGAYTGQSAFDRKTLQPGELVMIFPTEDQVQVVANALIGAITPRHEAPAEGAGEDSRVADAIHRLEGPGLASNMGAHTKTVQSDDIRTVLSALRARSSAPEAREGEAVAWTRQDQITALQFGGPARVFAHRSSANPIALFTAAPSADKLRIGLDEIERLVNQSGAIPKGELRSVLAALKAEGA